MAIPAPKRKAALPGMATGVGRSVATVWTSVWTFVWTSVWTWHEGQLTRCSWLLLISGCC
jgi:hypothetical protein